MNLWGMETPDLHFLYCFFLTFSFLIPPCKIKQNQQLPESVLFRHSKSCHA